MKICGLETCKFGFFSLLYKHFARLVRTYYYYIASNKDRLISCGFPNWTRKQNCLIIYVYAPRQSYRSKRKSGVEWCKPPRFFNIEEKSPFYDQMNIEERFPKGEIARLWVITLPECVQYLILTITVRVLGI